MKKRSLQKILVRFPNWLGDAILASGALEQLKKAFPDALVGVIAPPLICQLFERDPRIASLFPYQVRGLQKYNPFHPMLLAIKKESFDLAILFTNSFSSAWQIRWTGAQRRLGFRSEARDFLLTDPIAFPKERGEQHLLVTYQNLLGSFLGCQPTSFLPPKLYLDRAKQKEAHRELEDHFQRRPIIGLSPQAAYGPAKEWPLASFRKLTLLLVASGYGVVVFGDAKASVKGELICKGIESSLVLDKTGKTDLPSFMAFLQSCSLLVTNDSGPMHLAAALGVDLLALFGPTDPRVTGPYSEGRSEKREVIHKAVSCSPCRHRVCPIDFRCMHTITVEEVLTRIAAKKISPSARRASL